MSQVPKQPQQGADGDPVWILIVLGLGVLLALIFWAAAHTVLAQFYGWVRIAQFSIFKLIHSRWAIGPGVILAGTGAIIAKLERKRIRLAKWCFFPGVFLIVAGLLGGIYASWFDFFWGSDPSLILFQHLTDSSMWANGFTWLAFLVPMCIWTARRSLQTNPLNHLHFARPADYTLHSFSDEMAQYYPHVGLFRKINLTARPIDSGKYRMPDTEKQFAMKHKLLDRVGKDKDGTYKINSERSATVFRRQVGKLWRNFGDLSRWEVAVFSVLVPRIAATDPEMSDDDYKAALKTTNTLVASYWEQANRTYDTKTDTLTIDVSAGIAAIRKYYRSPKVSRYFKRHAYVYTILYAMLNDARTLGVLASNELRWLRVVDRRLWLVINNVGRNVAWTEVSGVYGHFQHELKKKRPLEKLEVNTAVKGLVEAIDGYRFSEDEIEKINSQIDSDEKTQTVIDPKSVRKERSTVILGSLRVREADKEDFLELSLVGEDGVTLYTQRCQPAVSREAIERLYHLTDAEMSELLKMPLSQDARKKVLELCNGQDVVAFYPAECELIPGLDRSATSLATLEDPDEKQDLSTTGMMEQVIPRSHVIHTAVDAANVVRLLWIEQKKAEMRNAQSASGPASGQKPS
jgi:hypothetical protein